MADEAKPPSIDPALLEEARAKGVDDAVVADYNERFDRDGPWIEAWRHWE